MDDMPLDAWEEARFGVRFGAMKVDAGRRPVRFWGCHAIADLRKTLMDGSGSTGWACHGGTLLLPKFGQMNGERTAGRYLDESDVDRDPAVVLCRRDLPSLLLPIPAIELPLSCQIWLDSRLGRKKSMKVASWLAGSMRFGAVGNEDGGCHRLLLDLLEDLKMERNNEAAMVGFEQSLASHCLDRMNATGDDRFHHRRAFAWLQYADRTFAGVVPDGDLLEKMEHRNSTFHRAPNVHDEGWVYATTKVGVGVKWEDVGWV
ncbi:hypothetical protein ACLOJK_018853 [Asimina triloba]